MSSSVDLECTSIAAGADLSALQYTALKLGADRVVVSCTSNNEPIVGILQDKPAAAGRAAKVGVKGISKAIAGGSISSGDKLTATTGGKLIATTTNNHYIIGHAMEDAASNDVFQVFLTPGAQHGA